MALTTGGEFVIIWALPWYQRIQWAESTVIIVGIFTPRSVDVGTGRRCRLLFNSESQQRGSFSKASAKQQQQSLVLFRSPENLFPPSLFYPNEVSHKERLLSNAIILWLSEWVNEPSSFIFSIRATKIGERNRGLIHKDYFWWGGWLLQQQPIVTHVQCMPSINPQLL